MSADDGDPSRLARKMAWFGIGLGTAEILAPRLLGRVFGFRTDGLFARNLLRASGVREIANGVAILLRDRRPLPIWGRVAGDAMDLGTLGLGMIARRSSTPRGLAAVAAVGGATALDVIAAMRVQRAFDAINPPVMAVVTINRPPAEVYAFYRRLEQLPVFMDYLESVVVLDEQTSHWVARLPVGKVGWTSTITEDVPGRVIAWTCDDSTLQHEGRVTFTRAPGRNATEVRVELSLGVAGIAPTPALARLFARAQIRGDLRRLKQLLETGEVLRSDASAHRLPHPAQPDPDAEPPPPIVLSRPPAEQKGDQP